MLTHKVRAHKIALTEPEGKTVILRSPSTSRPPTLPSPLPHAGLSACGELYYSDLLPVMMNPPALRRLASPTSICERLDPLITMPATSQH